MTSKHFWYRVGFVLLAVGVCFIVCRVTAKSEVVKIKIPNPALRGMVSSRDVGANSPEEAYYLLNGEVTETPGRIRRRTPIANYGPDTITNVKLYGAWGYYNSETGDKLVIGVADHDTISMGIFVVSDTFGTDINDTLSGTIFPYADVWHDWTPYKEFLVHADGKSTPAIFTTSEGFTYQLSKPDTFGYKPHLISMGMEAPGQPRVGVIDTGITTTNLNGTFTYAFAFDTDSVLGIESRSVTVNDAAVYITNLPMNMQIHILRKSGQSENQWYRIYSDSITQSGFYYIDTGATLDTALTRVVRWKTGGDTTSLFDTLPTNDLGGYRSNNCLLNYYPCVDGDLNFWDSLGYRRTINGSDVTEHCQGSYCYSSTPTITTDVDSFTIDSFYTVAPFEPNLTGRKPGQFYLDDVAGSAGAVDTTHAAKPESLYYIAYSYYDPVTRIESPLGPILACSLTVAYLADSVKANRFKFDDFDTTLNSKWIRVYQTITKTTLPGAGDSLVYYGLFELRNLREDVVFGEWNDDDIVAGLDTSYLDINLYYLYQLLRNDIGGVKVLPPYNYDLQIPFSDVEYSYGRFWGIGDPEHPNRIYYSRVDAPEQGIFSWHPLDFWEINELGDDQFVALIPAEGFGRDALYAIAHNSVWLVDIYEYQNISARIGAALREGIVKHGEVVYFLSPDMRIYALAGRNLVNISAPVENQLDSTFLSYSFFGEYGGFRARAHSFGDYVRWFNDSSGLGIAFNTKPTSGVWSQVRYGDGTYIPRGSFVYDTLHGSGVSVAPTADLELLYAEDTLPFRKADPTGDRDATEIRANAAIPFVYQTGAIGDPDRNSQVQQIDMTINVIKTGSFTYEIRNEADSSLCSDTLDYGSPGVKYLRLHPPYNLGQQLSVRISSPDTDSVWVTDHWAHYYNNFEIWDMTIHLRDMGVANVQ